MPGAGRPPAAPGAADAARQTPRAILATSARLMAARWRVAYNGFVRGARWRRVIYLVVAGALAVLTLFTLLTSYVMTFGILRLTTAERAPDVIVSSAFTGGLTLAVLVSFTVALAALYLSADLDLLLAAPVARRAVFVSKLVGGLLPTHLVVVLMTLVPLVGHGLAMEYGRAYYLAVALALALLPLLPTAVGALAVMVIVRQVSAHRLGEVVGLIVVAMTLSIAFVAGSAQELQEALTLADLLGFLERLRSPWSPAEWLTSAVVAAGRHRPGPAAAWFALTIGVTAAAFVPLYVASGRLYFEGWMRMQSADRRREATGGRLPWNRVDRATSLGRPSGLFRALPAPMVAVLRKDLRVIPRDLTNMAQALSPLAVGVFFILQQVLYPLRIGRADRPQAFTAPLLAMLSVTIAAGVSAMIMSRFGLTAFSAEGRAYWVLKSAPISRRQLVGAKFLVAYLPYLGLAAVLVVLLELARAVSDAREMGGPFLEVMLARVQPGMLAYGLVVIAVAGAGVIAITLALGAARPNMRWDTPHEMLTPDVGCLSLVLYGAYVFVVGMALALPAAVSGFGTLPNPGLLWAAGLAVGLAVSAVVVGGSLALAVAELDAIGED